MIADFVQASFGVGVSTSMVTVPGRVLSAPAIKYRGNDTEVPRSGSWNMSKVRFTSSATIPAWTYLWIKRAGRPGQIEENNLLKPVVTRFHEIMNASGLNAPAPTVPGPTVMLDAANATQTNDQLIVSMMQRIAANEKRVGLLFVLLPDTDAAVYNKVKYAADVLYGIHTVGSVDSKLAKARGRDQYLANIALKVNSKLLGVNQTIDMSKLGIIAEGKTMVVGIDVTHPSPGSLSSAPSVASIVASTDKNLSQFPCELRIQKGRKEMVTDLKDMFQSRLDLWKARNKTLPENILVYRDGVSEGQYQALLDDEIPSLREGCKLVYPADQTKKGLPKISVIVVGKRHHTRFYATKENEADRSGNPMNGTVVDRGVTSMWDWDFFLQAHTCLQGTAKPAHYYVVLDEIFGKGNLKKPHPFPNAADTLEDLTHNMCYLFARATKAISICPPAYYADLACERARCYLSGVFDPATPGGSSVSGGTQATVTAADVSIHERLKNSMFYL
jgi:eukaryotic translation initiation factor 2C